MFATATAATEATTEATEGLHITFGEIVLSGATLLLALVTVVLVIVSGKLAKATTQAAAVEMGKVADHATDNMAEVADHATDNMAHVARSAITRSAPVSGPYSPTYGMGHRPVRRVEVRKHV